MQRLHVCFMKDRIISFSKDSFEFDFSLLSLNCDAEENVESEKWMCWITSDSSCTEQSWQDSFPIVQTSNHSDLAIVQTLTLDINCQESFIARSADPEPRSQTVGPCRVLSLAPRPQTLHDPGLAQDWPWGIKFVYSGPGVPGPGQSHDVMQHWPGSALHCG